MHQLLSTAVTTTVVLRHCLSPSVLMLDFFSGFTHNFMALLQLFGVMQHFTNYKLSGYVLDVMYSSSTDV